MKKTLLKTLLLACILGIWGANAHAAVVLDFTNAYTEWGIPSGSSNGLKGPETYTNGTYSITLCAADAYYFNSQGYLMLGKSGSYLTLPTVDFAVGTIVVGGRSGASANTVMNIYVDDTAVSTACTSSQEDHTYVIDSNYQTVGTTYTFKITNAYNAQITSITLYAVDEEEGGDTPNDHGYSADDPFTCEEALALAKELDSSTTLSGVYVKGVISQIDEISTSYGNATYYISDDGTTTDHLEVFRGYSLNGDKFTSEDEIKVGDEVIVNGDLVDYNGNTPEITTGSKIYSINGSTEKPDGGGDGGGGDDGYHDGDVSTSSSTLTLTNPNVSVGTETTSIDFTTMSFTNPESVDGRSFTFDDNSTVTFAKADGTTAPAWYDTNSSIRVYADNTLTFTCEKVIAKIELHDYSSSYNGNTTTETVEFSDDGKSAIYCNQYTSTSGGTQLRVQSITIYYEGEGGDDEPEPTGHGYEPDDPYSCVEAIDVISALASGGTIEGIYVKGIVSQIGTYSSSYGDLIYYISDDGTTSNQLEIYYGFYLNNEKFTDNYEEELMVGDEVIVYGTFTNYNGKTPEGSQASTYIYSLTRSGETPEPNPDDEHTFNFAENTYGMTVYSGSDGDFETEVTQITSDGVVLNFDSGHYRMWNSTAEGNHLRIGGSTSSSYDAYCTISGPTGSKVKEVVITSTGSSDNMSESNPTVDPEGGSYASHVYTWTGEAESVTFHFTSVTHVYYIDVTTDAEATTGTFTITSAGYATYYTDAEYVMPEGVTGTTVTGVEDEEQTDGGYLLDTAWGYAAGSTVPAGTALVLKGEAGTYTYAITSTNAEAPTGNLLLGSTTSVETTGPNGETTGYVFYELTNGSSGIGFYYGATDGAAFTSAANKAWLALTESQSRNARFLGFGDGDTTGISSVEANDGAKVSGIYTIQGVRVSDMSQKGIYIVDGRKILVK